MVNYIRIINHMVKLGYKDHWIGYTCGWIAELIDKGVKNVSSVERKILNTKEKNDCSDIVTEVRIASILVRSGFTSLVLEPKRKGPDIDACYDGQKIHFEVTRRRAEVDEWDDNFDPNSLGQDRMEDTIYRIQNKLPQLIPGEINIIVLFSSTLRLETTDVAEAFGSIRQEIQHNPGAYKNLSGILFIEGGAINISNMHQFELFVNDSAIAPLNQTLVKKFSKLSEYDEEYLKFRFQHLVPYLKKKIH